MEKLKGRFDGKKEFNRLKKVLEQLEKESGARHRGARFDNPGGGYDYSPHPEAIKKGAIIGVGIGTVLIIVIVVVLAPVGI